MPPWPFPLQTTGCKSGPRTHPWTTGKDPLSGRPELLVGRRDAHRLGLSREPEQAPGSSAKSHRTLPTTPGQERYGISLIVIIITGTV